MIKISKKRTSWGSEHPYCDTIQLVIIVLFFIVWVANSLSYFIFNFSTVLVGLTFLPLRLLLAILVISFSLYLVSKSHKSVFGDAVDPPKLVNSDVYSLVRHPMYLGTLLFCLAFFFGMPSLLSLVIWLGFFIFYDKMATYEENDLIRILGEEYINYQKRVPKWFPRILKAN